MSSHASGLASIALEEEFNGTIEIVSYLGEEGGNYLHEDTTIELPAIALATALALSGTAALANTVHQKSVARTDRDAVGTVQLHPNCGNPDDPTTLSGTGNSQFGGSSPGTSGYN